MSKALGPIESREWTWLDKSEWGKGAWVGEPDKIQWTDEATGLPCLIVRNTRVSGALCGYVGVPPSHPAYMRGYYDVNIEEHPHVGLTYAGRCQHTEHGICHVVPPDVEDDIWWLGFDCAHSCDLSPLMEVKLSEYRKKDKKLASLYAKVQASGGFRDVYRNVAYVKGEVRELARQLAALQPTVRTRLKGLWFRMVTWAVPGWRQRIALFQLKWGFWRLRRWSKRSQFPVDKDTRN